MRTAEQVIRSSDELERSVGESVAALALAEALDGPEVVQSAAFAARGQVSLTVNVTNVYSLTNVSSRIEEVAEAFETQLDLIIELASSEMRLRRLAEEIGRTTRRVNALENVLIPRLEAQRNYAQMVLEEREREDLFRLKRVKMKLERRVASQQKGGQIRS
jgi:V/A-type H+-transporting ATPase subunit D